MEQRTLTIVLVLAACVGESPHRQVEPQATSVSVSTSTLPPCPVFESPQPTGIVTDPEVDEASGIAASRRQPGVLWLHNDSGDRARLFATDREGARLGRFELVGATAQDWEDLALVAGVTGEADALLVADIGDNTRSRELVRLFRVPEPQADPADGVHRIEGVEEFELRYPDGSHDAETLWWDWPRAEALIVTKTDNAAVVYRAPAPLGSSDVLVRVTDIPLARLGMGDGRATAGDISRDGSLIAIRGYHSALAWRRLPGDTLAEALTRAPCPLAMPDAPGGEAFAWLADGGGFVLVAEGSRSPLWRALAL